MVRKIVCTLLLSLMVSLLTVSAGADHAWVIDDAALYTQSEIEQMETMILQMVNTYQMDIGVLTTRDVPYANGDDHVTVDYADTYYENNGYGLGEDRAGVLLILDMTNRYNYLSTAGTMADYLNDHRIEEILSSADDALYSGEYGRAMLSELRTINQFLNEGIEEGSFRYDVETGERLTGIYNKLTASELQLGVVCGVAIMLIMYLGVSRSYLLKGKTYHYSLGKENVRVKMQVDDEQYIRERVTRVPIPRTSGGRGGGGGGGGGRGSGMHMSSGGMSHGGGGHHF